MILTPKIERAIKRASELHDGHLRKSEIPLPYITHLFSVAAILSTYAPDEEDIIVAGLLHDTLEDTPYTGEALEQEFGKEIRGMVESVTELTSSEKEQGRTPWRERKERYLEKLKSASVGALMVSAADKIHNLQSLIEDYRKHGPSIWKNFNAKLEDQLWFFGAVLALLEERLESDIVSHFKRVYDEAKVTFTT